MGTGRKTGPRPTLSADKVGKGAARAHHGDLGPQGVGHRPRNAACLSEPAMNFLRSLLLRLKAVFIKDSMDRDMAEQMQRLLDLMTEENARAGMKPADA